jgi:ketosteroid isomerase-like protein
MNMRSTLALLFSTLVAGLLLPGPAQAQDDADVQKEIEAQYRKLAEANEKEDIAAILALRTPDFHSIGPDGRVVDCKSMEQYSRQFLEMNQPPYNIRVTIQKLAVSENKLIAVADVFQEASRYRDYDGVRRKVDTSVLQRETWSKTADGWKLKSVDNVHDQKRVVDGKRVDPTKPYDPNAPPYNPDEPRKP